MYDDEARLGRMIGGFPLVAVFIPCLGLFGMAAFTVQRRTKEIGVRKVLGASTKDVVVLLLRDFVKLVIAGYVFAIPVAFYAMQTWLESFAYHVPLGVKVFALAGAIAFTVALVTVGYQTIRAAGTEPAQALRSE